MRLLDNWWEYLPTFVRCLSVVVALLALSGHLALPLDYFWE